MKWVIDELRLIVDHHNGPLFGVIRFPVRHKFVARISGLREIGPRQTDFIRESLLARSDFPSLGTFWQPMHDGRHFLVLRTAEPAPGKPITIVTNWQAALKK